MKPILLLLALSTLVPTVAQAQQRGDWVLGQWRGGQYWFPGVVEERRRDSVTIVYDDGTRETVGLRRVRPYTWRVGTWVQCRWQGGSEWYAGEITGMTRDGIHIDVLYEDGERERLPTGACRSE